MPIRISATTPVSLLFITMILMQNYNFYLYLFVNCFVFTYFQPITQHLSGEQHEKYLYNQPTRHGKHGRVARRNTCPNYTNQWKVGVSLCFTYSYFEHVLQHCKKNSMRRASASNAVTKSLLVLH